MVQFEPGAAGPERDGRSRTTGLDDLNAGEVRGEPDLYQGVDVMVGGVDEGDGLGASVRGGGPRATHPHRGVCDGIAQRPHQTDEFGGTGSGGDPGDRLRFRTIDGELGPGDHPDIGDQRAVRAGGADLPVRSGQDRGRRGDAGHQIVQERLTGGIGHGISLTHVLTGLPTRTTLRPII